MSNELVQNIDNLYQKVRDIIDKARVRVYNIANFEMVQAYWNIGREIVEEEQSGKERAEYGVYLVKKLSENLSGKYGKGFEERNLFYMKQFYQVFPKVNALRSELSWTHYRLLLRVENASLARFCKACGSNIVLIRIYRQITKNYRITNPLLFAFY